MTPTRTRAARPWRGPAARQAIVAALALGAVASLAGCGTNAAGDALSDHSPPTLALTKLASSDSSLSVNAHVADNLGILSVHVQASGAGINAVFDTVFTTAVASVDLPYILPIPTSVPAGTMVTFVGVAVDGAHNLSRTDSLLVATGTSGTSTAIITSPASGDTAVKDFSIAISLSGKTPNKVRALGYIASGVFPTPKRDSVLYSSPLRDSVSVDTSLSLVGASAGQLTLTPFLQDSLNRTLLGPPVTVTVVAAAGTNTVPTVGFGITPRVEVSDTIHVNAKDQAGVQWLGYEMRQLPANGGASVAADSFQITTKASSAVHTFRLALPVTTFPTSLEVEAFARNNSGTRAYAQSGGADLVDTVIVVAGRTDALPNGQGGTIADALFHPPTNRLFLSNIDDNVLDVFSLDSLTFETNPIQVGSRPWGMAAWPRDRSGDVGDTILVANSGGTLISYVNASSEQEVYRYPLPQITVSTVTTVTGANGANMEQLTPHYFSDRPQYLATTCTGSTAPGSPCGDVVLVYSTTPTPGQTIPFVNDGTVRWENLINHTSHFFFEQAIGQSTGQADTLEIDKFAAGGVGRDSVLVPFQEKFISSDKVDTASYSTVVQIPFLGFRDTTFVRNSGNFRRAIIGEGGAVGSNGQQPGSRALMYDVTSGFDSTFVTTKGTNTYTYTLPVPTQDAGISSPASVRSFIANAYTSVSGVAINFDGALSAIRGDSTYLVDSGLRLQGLLQTSGGNPGLDFHPDNTGIGPGESVPHSRVLFAASSRPEIQVYDTYDYSPCLVVPTRDPILGPIKSTLRPNGDVVLVGATASGVVIVTLTPSQLTSCP